MKNQTLLLAFLLPLALGCPKAPETSPSTPPSRPPEKAAHAATPVESPPPPPGDAPRPAGEAAQPAGDVAPGDHGGPAVGIQRGTMVRGLKECVDAELAQRKLNEFGDPEGTMYAGGTPLMDEPTGKSTDRVDYIFKRHPDIKAACVRPAP